jgi:hypothetical protein
VGAGNGVFYGTPHAYVVVFGVCYVEAMLGEVFITVARGEVYVFKVEGMVSLGT